MSAQIALARVPLAASEYSLNPMPAMKKPAAVTKQRGKNTRGVAAEKKKEKRGKGERDAAADGEHDVAAAQKKRGQMTRSDESTNTYTFSSEKKWPTSYTTTKTMAGVDFSVTSELTGIWMNTENKEVCEYWKDVYVAERPVGKLHDAVRKKIERDHPSARR